MKRIAVSALVPLALLAACGTTPGAPSQSSLTPVPSTPPVESSAPATPPSASGVPSSRPTVTVTATTTSTPSTGTSDLPAPTSTKPAKVKHNPGRPPLVKGARLAGHQAYDRLVIDLQGAMTGYTVDWVKQLVEDGSGDAINIKGGAYLQVTLSPANAHTEDGKPTWGRSAVVGSGLTNLRSVVRAGDFEGVVTVALILRHRAGFRVIEQSAPSRLVIDVAH
jgi:hypothetical protein